MSEPAKPRPRINPLLDEEDLFGPPAPPAPTPEPEETIDREPEWVRRAIEKAERQEAAAAEAQKLAWPKWPMFAGIAVFPFYLTTLGSVLGIAVGLTITGWLLMFWIQYGAVMGGTTARLLGLPPLATGALTLGYAASYCLIVIEETSYGADAVETWPDFNCKEWLWNLFHVTALGAQAALAGAAVQFLGGSNSMFSMLVGALAALPFVLLGALAAEGAWVPTALGSVLRSVASAWWAWGLFFLETTPLIVLWIYVTQAGLSGPSPWATPLYSGPLLSLVIVLYARILGRLAGCIRVASESQEP